MLFKMWPAPLGMTSVLLVVLSVATCFGNTAFAQAHDGATAAYRVQLLDIKSRVVSVSATLPVNGKKLLMDDTRSGEVPEVGDKGWPALVRDLSVRDDNGLPVEITSKGASGWELKEAHNGVLTLTYQVDYIGIEAAQWPAPRETAFADAGHFAFVGRSLFIMTPGSEKIRVTFALPARWHSVTPWKRTGPDTYLASSSPDLVENLIVITNAATDIVESGGFRVLVTKMGHWSAVGPDIIRVLRGVIPRYVRMMGAGRQETYSVVLLPILDKGGESFRSSFAFNVPTAPSSANRSEWGHTIAHEIFHYWNGWRLLGADYASSQWFQEGFTDYFADVAMVGAGLITPDEFRQRIGVQIAKYRNLKTTLAAPGTRKGPPLYGGGALVALCWDIRIRNASQGKHDLGDFFKTLWHQTQSGKRPYTWNDIHAALKITEPLDWDAFYRKYIEGPDKLPLDETFPTAGIRVGKTADGTETVMMDERAPAKAKELWKGLTHSK